MLSPRLLPPQFLLPAWSARQLCTTQRANKPESALTRSLVQGQEDERTILPSGWKSTEKQGVLHTGEDRYEKLDFAAKPSTDGTVASGHNKLFAIRRGRGGAAVVPGRVQRSPPSAGEPIQGIKTGNDEEQPSIFDELFPEGKGLQSGGIEDHSDSAEECHVPRQPAGFQLPKGVSWTTMDDLWDGLPKASSQRAEDTTQIPVRRTVRKEVTSHREITVLILSNASKTLTRSDFDRLSPKGEHIEGWTSGIIKGWSFAHAAVFTLTDHIS